MFQHRYNHFTLATATLSITAKPISSQNDFLLSDITEGKVNLCVILTEATANANKAKYDNETAGTETEKAPGNLCASTVHGMEQLVTNGFHAPEVDD